MEISKKDMNVLLKAQQGELNAVKNLLNKFITINITKYTILFQNITKVTFELQIIDIY